jgi:hypothetical protein
MKKQWKLIGGYGQIGDTNWGFNESKIESDKWLAECQKHIGETVLLTGGGSLGKAWLAKLTDVKLEKLGNNLVPQVRLENLKPKWDSYTKENIFTPYLGSWQISVKGK